MFEHSLIDLEAKQQPRRRRWISLPIAIALHVVGVTAFAFASYWTVGAVTEPMITDIFFIGAPLPELSTDGNDGRRPKTPETKPQQEETKPVKPSQPVQPTENTVPVQAPVPTTTSTTTTLDDLSTSSGTEERWNGIPGPRVGPSIGSDGSGKSSDHGHIDGPEISKEDGQPIRVTVGMTKPEPIHKVPPRYPEAALKAGIQGAVILEAVIDEQGNVDNVRILQGLPMGLDREAVSAVQQWKFKPAMLASKPVKVYFTLTINFTIQR